MYELAHFKLEDPAECLQIIRAFPLGLLISGGKEGLMANPLPFLIATGPDGGIALRAHLARANPHWRAIAENPEVLVTFQAGDYYVSPSWYASKREHGKVVPTWNYVHVQVRGLARLQDDSDFLAAQLDGLTEQQEAARPDPWGVADAPAPFIAAQSRAIIGLEIAVHSISGKAKLSQNRQPADRDGVIAGLSAESDPAGPHLAAMMRAVKDKHQR